MSEIPEGDYVLRNSQRIMVLNDIICRLGQTPAAQELDRQRALIRADIAAIATRMLLALATPYRAQPALCADLKAETATAIRHDGFSDILFGQICLKTQVWPAILTALQENWEDALTLRVTTHQDLPATTPVLDFITVGALFSPVTSLPVASLKILTALPTKSMTPELRRHKKALDDALEQAKAASAHLLDHYRDLPALAATIANTMNWRDLIARYPRAIEITQLHPRGAPPPAGLSTAVSILTSL